MSLRLDIRPWTEADDAEAVALEARMITGERLRTSWRRATFRSRAALFEEHEILVARHDGELVGLVAVRFKDLAVHGRAERGAFYFDLRVDPGWRRAGVASALIAAVDELARDRATLRYSYVVDDPHAQQAMGGLFGSSPVGGYTLLVAPTSHDLPVGSTVRPATAEGVHESLLASRPPFDFYSDPRRGGPLVGHVASWLAEDDDAIAGCSVWDNRDLVAEVVASVPGGLAALARLAHWGPFAHLRLPHLPLPGEQLRCWTLFDVHATTRSVGRSLLRHMLGEARDAGIDYCYVLLSDGDPLLELFRDELPAYFAPMLRYRLHALSADGPIAPVSRLYVDVRDV